LLKKKASLSIIIIIIITAFVSVLAVIISECCRWIAVDLLADMYENAHKRQPDNEEILNSLFMAYVRLGMCQKQQQVNVCGYCY